MQVLLIEDIAIYTSLLQHMLAEDGITLDNAVTLQEGLEKAGLNSYDAVLLDLGLPDSQDLDTFTTFSSMFPRLPIVILSGLSNEQTAAAAVHAGAQDYLVKGSYLIKGEAGKRLLVHSLRYAVERKQIQTELINERNLLEQRVQERTHLLNRINQELAVELEERKRVQDELAHSEEKNRSLVEALPDIICRLDPEGVVLDLKIPAEYETVFPPASTFLGKHFLKAFPDYPIEQVMPYYQKNQDTGSVQIAEIEFGADDDKRFYEVRILSHPDAETLIIVRDVTEIKIIERIWRRYEFIANTNKDFLALIDRLYRFEAVNDAYCQAARRQRDQIIGKTVADIWGEELFETQFHSKLEACFTNQVTSVSNWTNAVEPGRRFLEATFYPFLDQDNQVTHAVVSIHDGTSEKLAQEKLNLINTRLSIMQDISRLTLGAGSSHEIALVALRHFALLARADYSAILLMNEENTLVTFFCEQCAGHSNRRRENIPVAGFLSLEHLLGRDYHLLPDLALQSAPTLFENELFKKDICTLLTIPMPGKKTLTGVLALGNRCNKPFVEEDLISVLDASRQLSLSVRNARLFEQVSTGQTRLRHLTERLVSVQEDERRQISLELHDDAGQTLTALKLQLSLIQSEVSPKNEKVQRKLKDAIALTEATIEEVRSLAHNLHPPALDEVGLDQAMDDYCRHFASATGIKIEFSGTELQGLSESTLLTLYRVLQEALSNAQRHAQAASIKIDLYTDGHSATLQVKDDGKGFDYHLFKTTGSTSSLGLLSITERIEALGGVFEIFSQPGAGTTLRACIPVLEKEAG